MAFQAIRPRTAAGRRLFLLLLTLLICAPAAAQIRVHPTGVNVNASGATTVFLTYGGLGDYVPAEAFWCGALVDAFPDVGARCDPSTLFGSLPLRNDLSTRSGSVFTDIMSIPPSVARRAYQAAQQLAVRPDEDVEVAFRKRALADDGDSRFYYVRRFEGPAGQPDVFVAVTCRLAGGGARVPFALLDVQMAFGVDVPLLSVEHGEAVPPFFAEIAYNGTGQLRGRWEIVRPGEEVPTERDLLTEATLPPAERASQRSYTELERFSYYLPPSTQPFRLPGPDPDRLPTDVDGLYQILLRIEATADKEGDSDFAAVGAGGGISHNGAVAGFPMPTLRYYVGGAASDFVAPIPGVLHPLLPARDATLGLAATVDFSWTEVPQAALYRLDIQGDEGQILSALLTASRTVYRAPPWLTDEARAARWRVEALDFGGNLVGRTAWRSLRIGGE